MVDVELVVLLVASAVVDVVVVVSGTVVDVTVVEISAVVVSAVVVSKVVDSWSVVVVDIFCVVDVPSSVVL